MDMDNGCSAQSTEGLHHLVSRLSGDDDDGEAAMPSWPESSSPPRPLQLARDSEDLILMLRSTPMYSPPRLLPHGVSSLDYYCTGQSPPCGSWSQEEFFCRLWSYDDGYMEMNSAPAAPNHRAVAAVQVVAGLGSSAEGKPKREDIKHVYDKLANVLAEAVLKHFDTPKKFLVRVDNLCLENMRFFKVISIIEEKENESILILSISISCDSITEDFRSCLQLSGYCIAMALNKARAKLKELTGKLSDLTLSPRKNACDSLKFSSTEVNDAASMSNILGSETKAVLVILMRDKVLEMNNPYDVQIIRNERRGCSEPNELGHKDVQVQPRDPSRKRKACATTSSKKSIAWLHFTKVVDTEGSGVVKAECKHCGKLLKADPKINGTSRLLRHITDVHQMELDGSPSTNRAAPSQ